MSVVLEGKERLYTFSNLTKLEVDGKVVVDRGSFGPERALEQALMSFPGEADLVTTVHEGLFLIMFATEVKRLEQNPDVDPKHPTLERLFRRLPSVYDYMRQSNVRLGNVLHANDHAA